MSIKKLAVLVVVLIALVCLFLIIDSANNKGLSIKQQAFPDVADKVAGVLIEEGQASVELKVENGRWIVPARYGYLADVGKVNALILRITDLNLFQKVTDRAERHELLGVDADVKKSGKVKIAFFDRDNKLLGALFASEVPDTKARSKMSGDSSFYVRKEGENNVFSVGESLTFQTKPEYWLLSQIANIDQNAIRVVEQGSVSAENIIPDFKIERNANIGEEELFKLAGSETGKQGNSEVVSLVASGLVNLRLDDVVKSDSDYAASLSFDKVTVYTLLNGMVYRVASAYKDGNSYIKISTSFNQSLVAETKQAQNDVTSSQSSSSSSFNGNDEVTALNGQFSGWIYKVPEYAGTKFRKVLSDVTDLKGK